MTPINKNMSNSVCSPPQRIGRDHHKWPFRTDDRRRAFFRLGIVFAALVVLVATASAVLAYQASTVRIQLEQTMAVVPELRSELGLGQYDDAQQTLNQMQELTEAASSTTTGPLWKVASLIPFVGPNLSAVTDASVSADNVASLAVPLLLENFNALDWNAVTPVDGRVNASQIQGVAPSVNKAADTVRLSYERLASIDRSRLVAQVAEPLISATDQLKKASELLGTAAAAVELLPPLLGTEGERNYLVLTQNNAETRATGGIPGAVAILNTNEGRISLGEQQSASALGTFMPPIKVDPEQESLFTERLGKHMQNVNLTPDFPTAAATARSMWKERYPAYRVDGVIALDPVVLAHLLGATGPVELTNPEVLTLIKGTSLATSLSQDNVVRTLLSDVYREIAEPSAQDAYFAAVAGQVFAAFAQGQGESADLMAALNTSMRDGRLYLWSAHPDEQELIASTALAGSVSDPQAGFAPFGVYLNDGTGAKMDYYVSRTAQLLQTCRPDGYSNYAVRVTVANNAPSDAATSLPAYVTGRGVFGVEPGHIRTNYVFYGPAQAFVEAASVNGQPVPIGSGKHDQRPVGTVTLELAPGETAELDVVFSHIVQDSDPKLQVTPGLEPIEKVILPAERAICR